MNTNIFILHWPVLCSQNQHTLAQFGQFSVQPTHRTTLVGSLISKLFFSQSSTRITALIAYVTIKKTVLLGLLPLLLEMVSVMMGPTMLTAITMVETAVDPALTLITVLNVHVLVKLLAMEFQMLQLEMVFVMTRPTMLTAITMVEIAVDHAH